MQRVDLWDSILGPQACPTRGQLWEDQVQEMSLLSHIPAEMSCTLTSFPVASLSVGRQCGVLGRARAQVLLLLQPLLTQNGIHIHSSPTIEPLPPFTSSSCPTDSDLLKVVRVRFLKLKPDHFAHYYP